MGKKLDAFLGRNTFKTEKFKPTVNLAISRLAVLKNNRHSRLRQARSDVLQLLQLGHHQRALLRVEHVIKEQNMLDVYDEIEGYCNLLIERVHLIAQQRECPEELKEASSGVLYAASRCGDFPEIQEIRSILTSRFGKDFAARAIELRNNCNVHSKIVTKLSTRMPSYEIRMKVLKEIANENNIVLQFPGVSSDVDEEQVTSKEEHNLQQKSEIIEEEKNLHNSPNGGVGKEEELSNSSFKAKKKYKDVAAAAQAAFESAANAAEAAKAAVELSRTQSHDPDDDNSSSTLPREVLENDYLKAMSSSLPLEGKEIVLTKGEEINKNAEEEEEEEEEEELEKPQQDICSSNSSDEISVDKEIEVDPIDTEVGSRVVSSPHEALLDSEMQQSAPFLDLEKRPFSVRTRRVQGY